MMRQISVIVLMTAALAVVIGFGQQPDQSEVDLQTAIRMETVEGNLKGAIEAYKKIADGSNRAIAAKALIRMGQCYEKQGDAEARKAYERVVREFADQKEAVEQARTLLAASARPRQPDSGVVVEQKWVLPGGAPTVMRQISPDGRYILYTKMYSSNRIYLHDLTTGEDRMVLESRKDDAFLGPPAISPDCRQIACTRYTYGGGVHGGHNYELVISGIDGSHPTVLVSEKERLIQPRAWSPDGKSILMTRAVGAEGLSLALLSVADHSLRELTTRSDYSSLCFSPDGRYVAAYRVGITAGRTPMEYNRSRVISFIIRSEATGEEREVFPVPAEAFNQTYPFPNMLKWSPDGTTLFYVEAGGGLWRLMRRNLENGEERELYQGKRPAGLIEGISLSADGRQLAFLLGNREEKTESVMILPAEGGSPRELYRSRTEINRIGWTKDNRHVLMECYSDSAPSKVWSVPMEGGEPQPSPFETGLFDVHPDGRRIVYSARKGGNEEVWVIKNLLSAPRVAR